MKKIWILVMLLVATTAWAQEETLFSGKLESGGFGGPVVKMTQFIDKSGILVGGRGGWIINHAFVIGGGGYGLVNEITASNDSLLSFGYGGVELEYVHRSNKLLHFTVQTLIGGGSVEYRDKRNKDAQNNDVHDDFFIAEPGVNVILNVSKNFRIGLGGSYRYVTGVSFRGLNNSDLSGPSAVLTFKFGSF